jgi:hypothetical protein
MVTRPLSRQPILCPPNPVTPDDPVTPADPATPLDPEEPPAGGCVICVVEGAFAE